MAEKFDDKLESIDESKRDTVRKLVQTAAFTAPAVASFAIDGKMNKALSGTLAMSSNS
jgi:hypothetical protein